MDTATHHPRGRGRRWARRATAAVAGLAMMTTTLMATPGTADAATEGQVGHVTIDRVAGNSRVETAIAISQDAFTQASTVVIARADEYADALAGAGLARSVGGPILLTDRTTLSPGITQELTRLGATKVLILGGEVAVSKGIEDTLSPFYEVSRFAGDDRFATAAAIGAAATDTSRVFVVEGRNANRSRGFPDALSVAPYAAHTGNPVLLTDATALPAATRSEIQRLAPQEIVVVGGSVAVSDAVYDELSGLAPSIRRIFGESRYQTSAKVYDEAVAAGMKPATRWLATGTSFPDALAAGPAVAAHEDLLLLVPGSSDVTSDPDVTARLRDDWCEANRIVLLGGGAAITTDAFSQLRAALPTTSCPGDGGGDGGGGGGGGDGDGLLQECDAYEPDQLQGLLDELDPDGDADGDGFTNKEEMVDLNFQQTAPTEFNPLVADIPVVDLQIVGDVSVTIDYTDSNGSQKAEAFASESERTDTKQDIDTRETTVTHHAGVEASGSVGEEGGDPKWAAELRVKYEYTNTSSHTVGTVNTTEERQAQSQSYSAATHNETTISGGTLSTTVRATNTGHVDYKLNNMTVRASLLGSNGPGSLVGSDLWTHPDGGVSLISGASTQAIQINIGLNARDALTYAQDPAGIAFDIESYALNEIGASHVQTDAADFAQHAQSIRANTALVKLDYGPDAEIERHFVATSFNRVDGSSVGTPLCQALATLLQKAVTTSVEDLTFDGGDTTVTVETMSSLTRRDGNTTVPHTEGPTSYWIADVSSPSVGNDITFGMSDVLLTKNDVAQLVFAEDADEDGLFRIQEERDLGTSDTDTDTDDDGIGDHDEVTTPLTVQVLGRDAYTVTSDPTSEDVDGDTLSDTQEIALGTDPGLADTDGDRVWDHVDVAPLDPANFATVPGALSHWTMDYAAASRACRTSGHSDGTGQHDDVAGPFDGSTWCYYVDANHLTTTGRSGAPFSAYRSQSSNGGLMPIQAGPLDLGTSFTVAGWIRRGDDPHRSQIFGSPSGMQLYVDSNHHLRFGTWQDTVGDQYPYSQTTTPMTLVDTSGNPVWRHVAVMGTHLNNGQVRIRLYIDGERVRHQQFDFTNNGNATPSLAEGPQCRTMGAPILDFGGACSSSVDGQSAGWQLNDQSIGQVPIDLDDMMLFTQALSDDQIRQLFADQAP